MRFIGSFLLLVTLALTSGCRASSGPLAGVELAIEFPDVGLTMNTMAGWGQGTAHATIKLPDDYSTERLFPALLFLIGPTGGDGRYIADGQRLADAAGGGFVVINLPIFVTEVPSLAPDGSNRWSRLDLHDEDGAPMWNAYRTMLERIHEIVPNLDLERSFAGGFSNGAHAIAALLNQNPAEIRHWFGRFFFFEGGERLTRFEALKGAPIAIVQGASQPTLFQEPLRDAAVAAGVDVEWILVEGAGHEMTGLGFERLGTWVKQHR